MNSLHVLLVALLLHRALVWRDERRRPRPAHRRAARRPVRLEPRPGDHGRADRHAVRAGGRTPRDRRVPRGSSSGPAARSSLGLLPYLYIPFRAMVGPADVYAPFLTWDGFFTHVSGAQFRSDMHFLSLDSMRAALAGDAPGRRPPHRRRSNVVFVGVGRLRHRPAACVRDRWFGSLLVVLGVDQRLLLRELPRRPVALPARDLAHPGHRARRSPRTGRRRASSC